MALLMVFLCAVFYICIRTLFHLCVDFRYMHHACHFHPTLLLPGDDEAEDPQSENPSRMQVGHANLTISLNRFSSIAQHFWRLALGQAGTPLYNMEASVPWTTPLWTFIASMPRSQILGYKWL